MNITFTGVDAHTTQTEIEDLLADPRVELGVLYTVFPERRTRYMYMPGVVQALEWCRGRGAIHVCGMSARGQLIQGKLAGMLALVGRVQVNGDMQSEQLMRIREAVPSTVEIITQFGCPTRNIDLVTAPVANHSILVDGSAGRGHLPDCWHRPQTDKPVGFAGGLRPQNVRHQVEEIRRVAVDPFWIDMETGVRSAEDVFDVRACLEVLRLVKNNE